MRKILSLITALVLCTTFVSAKTIYCKMEHSWWKVDNAAVGCHSWGTPGPGTTWPGVRMTPVEGETDLWSIELDTDKVQNVIFTRVNPSGAIADWGAKTKDLTIPTNGDNLFTITTSSESWGDPGCDGTWSKYEAPAGGLPQITEAPKSWAGEYVITAMKDDNTALVWTGIDAGQCRVEAPVVNNKLTDDNFVKVVVEALQDGGYSLKVKGGENDGKYMTQDATPTYKNGLKFVENPVRVDIEMDENGFVDIYQTINATQQVDFIYNNLAGDSNERFRFYKGENYTKTGYKLLTLFGTVAPEPAKTFDLTIVQDTVWSKDNAKIAAWIWADDLEGQWTSFATNVNDTLTLKVDERADSIILVRNAPEATEPTWDAWNRIDAGEIEDCHLFIITNWNEGVWCERPVVEAKYYAKNNWDNGDWAWLEMTKVEDLYVLDSVIFGGTGVNINTKEEDADAKWFDLKKMKYNEQDTIQALDTVRFELAVSDKDTVLTAILLGRPAQPEPAKTFDLTIVQDTVWSKDNAKIAAWIWADDLEGQWTSFATNVNDTLTLKVDERADSIILVRNAPEATEPTWDAWNRIDAGEIEDCHLFIITNWNEGVWCERPVVETKYYAKNNWDAGEWTWLEMSATNQENIYMLDSVVFGGTGVNINDKEDDTDALWFAADAITVLDGLDGLPGPIPPEPQRRDTIPYAPARMVAPLEAPTLLAGDTIKLFFNAADSTLSAAIVGRPEQPQPIEVKYYITGNAALCGEKAWDAQAIEMIDSTHTFEAMAAGEYEMKITNGAWDPEGQSWGSAALSEECSAGVDDKGGNIHFIVETPNNVIVSIANGKVTVTGTFKESSVTAGIKVNVTVPEGTPACFFYGEMSGNSFVEMTKVDETHYTIDFPKATTIGWGYKFVWENGNWSTCNADPEGDIKVEPVEGVITVEVKAWATAPGTEYKYTTYTEWQVKFGPAWEWVNMTKQEDGTFTVEAVWGNTGINIASGDNPIKQDWYPLDDAALTVAEDVAEGDNVVISLTVVNDNTVALNVAKKVTTNISNVKGQAGQRYNILGQPVNETYRGLVIMNGQTFLQK